jgi:hypothetical protein
MASMKRVKLCFAIIAVAACWSARPASAGDVAYLSASGGGASCTAASPCISFVNAFAALLPSGGRVLCLNPTAVTESMVFTGANVTFDIDCPAASWTNDSGASGLPIVRLTGGGPNVTVTFRNMAFNGINGATSAIKVGNDGAGTLIFENCSFTNFSSAALDIEANAAYNVVVTNSRISNSGSGVLLKPAAGGIVNATFNHVTITNNAGGGIKSDTTNGPVTVDIADSVVSYHGGNGINAVGAAGGQNIVNIKSSVIARNAAAGVQANGVNAGVLLAMTVLDQNSGGATSVVSGGNLFTYGNNEVVGPIGSGFTATAPMH